VESVFSFVFRLGLMVRVSCPTFIVFYFSLSVYHYRRIYGTQTSVNSYLRFVIGSFSHVIRQLRKIVFRIRNSTTRLILSISFLCLYLSRRPCHRFDMR